VAAILRRSCYDCHSNESRWPWYSYVAPISWLVASDVHEGREHVNFSDWGRSGHHHGTAETIEKIGEEVAGGDMPLWYYLPLHPGARLSKSDVETLKTWAGVTGEAEHEDEHGHK